MRNEQYQLKYISTSTTTHVVAGLVNTTIHTVVCPIATTGTVAFQSTESSPTTYFVLPVGSIGTLRFDIDVPLGLDVVTSASDKVIITYQTP